MASSHHYNNDGKIHQFWTWFVAVSEQFALNYENQHLLEELDQKVAEIGEIGWELGPGKLRECSLTLTPDGDLDWLPVTKRAVAMAPNLPSWEFYAAKQKKEWELQFSMETSDGRVVNVDARSWRYVLLQFPEGTFDIILEQTGLNNMVEDDCYTAATIVLDGVLGEENRLLTIEGIETTRDFSAEQLMKANSITVLEDHLRKCGAEP